MELYSACNSYLVSPSHRTVALMSTDGDPSATDRFIDELTNLMKARNPAILVETGEWRRLEGALISAVLREQPEGEKIRHILRYNEIRRLELCKLEYDSNGHVSGVNWTNADPLISTIADDPVTEIMMWFRDTLNGPAVLLMDDQHHMFTNDWNRQGYDHDYMQHWRYYVRLKHDSGVNFANRKTIVLAGETIGNLPELTHETVRMIMPLPEVDDLLIALDEVVVDFDLSTTNDVDRTPDFASAALGLSMMQAKTAFRQAVVEKGHLKSKDDPAQCARRCILKHKEQIISQSGALEYIEPKENLDDSVGGLENLKEWLHVRKSAYSMEARDRGLPMPKGIMLTGVPGCGKSLTSKAVAASWGFPLIRFDIGAVFGGIVGQSESNIRQALKVAEAASPCVLWIDEIEKGLAGAGGSGNLDSGTTQRVFGTILTWLNEVNRPVFVVATANNLLTLPPELKRKGRFDEIFFIDLPGEDAREQIFQIHIKAAEGEAGLEQCDIPKLASATHGWTGAEIETLVRDAQFRAFSEGNRPISMGDMLEMISITKPQSESMGDDIAEMRIEADKIGQRASTDTGAGRQKGRGNSTTSSNLIRN